MLPLPPTSWETGNPYWALIIVIEGIEISVGRKKRDTQSKGDQDSLPIIVTIPLPSVEGMGKRRAV